MSNNNNQQLYHNLYKQASLKMSNAELDGILANSLKHRGLTEGNLMAPWNNDSIRNKVNTDLSTRGITLDYMDETVNKYKKWQKDNEPLNLKLNAIWEKVRNKNLVEDVINTKKELNISQLLECQQQFINSNKELLSAELKTKSFSQQKPLGNFGDITLNDAITEGLSILETPLVNLIRDNVNINVVGNYIGAMFMYNAVVKLYMKSAYNQNLPDLLKNAPSTRVREVALFMLFAGPAIVGSLMTINKVTAGGTKIILKIAENTEVLTEAEVSGSGTSTIISNSFLFLILNKLPRWLKALLKYIAIYLILLFIVNVIGYKSNIVLEISSNFFVYLVYFLKIWSILNFFVVIYFFLRIYVLKMYVNKKNFINPDDYPKFIKVELIELKEIAIKTTPIELAKVYKHYYKLIILYISVVLLCLTGVYLGSLYIIP